MSRATARAAVCCTGALAAVLGTAGPALAANPLGPSEGEQPGRGLGIGATIVLYVAIPAVILLGTAALVWLPGLVRTGRYRPNRGWSAAPVWFAGPHDPVTAVQDADPGAIVRGGASGTW